MLNFEQLIGLILLLFIKFKENSVFKILKYFF